MHFDLPLNELQTYLPEREEPADFDAFWAQTLQETRTVPLNARFEPIDFGLHTVETYDVTFNGFSGQPVKAWLMLPRLRQGPLPCVVEFVGYGGGRGLPFYWLLWSAAGYASLVMDTRGQGGEWLRGDTPDSHPAGFDPHFPGCMTRGILDPQTYYYRRLFCDGVRAVEAARSHPQVVPQRVAVTGVSQGGGVSLAVAALLPDVSAVLPDVPFLCHCRRATEIVASDPYVEIARYCQVHRGKVEDVFRTLSYFDGVNFAARAQAPALFSVGLMDDICPPSTVFAAYNYYAGEKQIRVYPYNGHEGGGNDQEREQVRFLKMLWQT